MTPDQQDAMTEAIVKGEYRWCRARLLAALAAASTQGVLDDVIDELLGSEDGALTAAAMTRALSAARWLP